MDSKSGLHMSVCQSGSPETSISSFTIPSERLSKTTIFTGSLYSTIVARSPSSIESPPSPHSATTSCPGRAKAAPIAMGRALAIEP